MLFSRLSPVIDGELDLRLGGWTLDSLGIRHGSVRGRGGLVLLWAACGYLSLEIYHLQL